jgi:hypothetical protein
LDEPLPPLPPCWAWLVSGETITQANTAAKGRKSLIATSLGDFAPVASWFGVPRKSRYGIYRNRSEDRTPLAKKICRYHLIF